MKKIFAAALSLLMILGTAAPIWAIGAGTHTFVNNLPPKVMTKEEIPNPVILDAPKNIDILATVEDPNGPDDIFKVEYQFAGQGWQLMDFDPLIGKYKATKLLNPMPPGEYLIEVRATDKQLNISPIFWNFLMVQELVALNLGFANINFGNVDPGQKILPFAVGPITNAGNVEVDIHESATWNDALGNPVNTFDTNGAIGLPAPIPPPPQRPDGPWQIDARVGGADFDVNIAPGGNGIAHFDLLVPLGTKPGDYNGQITFDAIPPPPKPQCSDGIDNDGDGFIDLADPQCTDPADNNEYIV